MKPLTKLLICFLIIVGSTLGIYCGLTHYEEQKKHDAKFDQLMDFFYPYAERHVLDLEEYAAMQLSVLSYKINNEPVPYVIPYYNKIGTFTLTEKKAIRNDIGAMELFIIHSNGALLLSSHSDNRGKEYKDFQTIAWSAVDKVERLWALDIEDEGLPFEDVENEYKEIISEAQQALIRLTKYKRPGQVVYIQDFDSQLSRILNED